MQMNQFENQTPALIWVDRDIYNDENQTYCQQLEKNYPDCFFTINDEYQYFEVQKQNQDKQLIVISSGECAYNLVQMTLNPIIIFCKNKHYHYDLFLQNLQIKAILSDQFQDANALSIQCMNNIENINCFKELINPLQTISSPQYQHSKSNISIKFFVVIEEIRKSTKISEEKLKNELINLRAQQIKFQSQEQARLQVENELYKITKTEKDKKLNFKLYQKLLMLYTSEKLQLYSILNIKFAEYKYQEIKTILHLLFKGFKKMSKKQNYYLTLYRGISLKKQQFQQIVNDFNESQKYQTSLFWNSLVSTSVDIDVAYNFSFNDDYGIIYEISLDSENPHPHLKLQDDLTMFQNEQEILLFPQFEFVVQNIQSIEFSQNHLIVKIKQQKNNHAFILDQRLRNIYWRDIQDKNIYPKVKSIIEFNFLRLDQLFQIMYEQQYSIKQIQKSLELEITNNFTLLQQDLVQIYFNQKDQGAFQQIHNMINIFRKSIQFQNKSDNAYDYIQTFQVYFKKIKKALRTNICTLLLKGIIDLEFCEEILKALREQFKIAKEALNVPTFNSFGKQAQFFEQADFVSLNSAGMTNQQLKAQKITSIQKVQNSKSGNLAYEVTLKDGNRLLMHQNPNNKNMLMFNKQLDSQGKVGYTNKWKPIGQQEKISHLTVEDVQTSIKGKQGQFDFENVNKLEMNGKMQSARQTGQLGGAIATAAGSLAVDLYFDEFDGKKIGQAVAITAGVQGGFMYLQSIKSMSQAVPFVGIGLTAAMTSIQIGQVVVSDFLKTSEKYYNAVLVTIKTATTVGLGIAGVEGGMIVGAAGGPVGVIIGGIVGGLFGGAGGNLLNRCVDYFTQFQIEIQFTGENKSNVSNGFLIKPGQLPTIKWKNVKAKAKSLLLIAQADDKQICCIIPNIDPKKNSISHEDNLGLKLKGYKYLGPDKSAQEIIFRLYALMDEYVDDKDILYNLKKNNLKIFDQAVEKIKLVEQ